MIVCLKIYRHNIKWTECTSKRLKQTPMLSEPYARCTHSYPRVCVVLQPVCARTLETLISFHKSSVCACCSSAKECQVKLFWPGTNTVVFHNHPASPEAHTHTQTSKPVASCAPHLPLGNESHTSVIQLALGNRHLSLRMPLGTHRPIYE